MKFFPKNGCPANKLALKPHGHDRPTVKIKMISMLDNESIFKGKFRIDLIVHLSACF